MDTSADITGTLELDGRPLDDVALALVADDGRTVAVARSDAVGRSRCRGPRSRRRP